MSKKKKNQTIDDFTNYIKRNIINKQIKEELIDVLNYFKDYIYSINDNSLYAKAIEKNENDYLEIRYEKNKLYCHYTQYSTRESIIIDQNTSKFGTTTLNKVSNSNILHNDNTVEKEVEETSFIYNYNKTLMYEEQKKYHHSLTISNNQMLYQPNQAFSNFISLERNWYLNNGSILKHELSKHYINNQNQLKDNYFLCEKTYKTEFDGNCRFFEQIDKDLFEQILSNQISIEKVVEINNNNQKRLSKNVDK